MMQDGSAIDKSVFTFDSSFAILTTETSDPSKEASYSMKIKLGSSLTNAAAYVPGPGNYETSMKQKRDSPKYGFGSSTRDA